MNSGPINENVQDKARDLLRAMSEQDGLIYQMGVLIMHGDPDRTVVVMIHKDLSPSGPPDMNKIHEMSLAFRKFLGNIFGF